MKKLWLVEITESVLVIADSSRNAERLALRKAGDDLNGSASEFLTVFVAERRKRGLI